MKENSIIYAGQRAILPASSVSAMRNNFISSTPSSVHLKLKDTMKTRSRLPRKPMTHKKPTFWNGPLLTKKTRATSKAPESLLTLKMKSSMSLITQEETTSLQYLPMPSELMIKFSYTLFLRVPPKDLSARARVTLFKSCSTQLSLFCLFWLIRMLICITSRNRYETFSIWHEMLIFFYRNWQRSWWQVVQATIAWAYTLMVITLSLVQLIWRSAGSIWIWAASLIKLCNITQSHSLKFHSTTTTLCSPLHQLMVI